MSVVKTLLDRSIRTLPLLILLVIVSCSEIITAKLNGTEMIQVNCWDSSANAPCVGFELRLYKNDSLVLKTTIPNTGTMSLERLNESDFLLEISKSNYIKQMIRFRPSEVKSKEISVEMNKQVTMY